jgi:phosphosulfolactate synthase
VIAEARESGTVGMYRSTGEVREGLVEEVVHHIPWERLIFEAPQRSQQVWFIRRFGTNVNLGNIAPEEVISVETMRLGLRGDTFHTFLERGG